MNAKGLRVDGNIAPVAGNHYPSLRDAEGLPSCFFGVADQCVLKFA